MKKVSRFLVFLLLIFWMSMIFYLSAQNALESSTVSSGLTYKIVSVVYPEFKNLSQDKQAEILYALSFPIRKTAHFALFMGLGALMFWNISYFRKLKLGVKSLLSIGFSCLYAASDEYHQTFIKGRSGEIRDFLIDTAGICLAVILLSVIAAIVNKRKKALPENELLSRYNCLSLSLEEQIGENETLKEQLKESLEEIEILKAEISKRSIKEDIESLSEKSALKKEVEDITEEKTYESELKDYGAVIIGKTVISCAEYSARVQERDSEETQNAKAEMLNRTELLKERIIEIIYSDYSLDSKKQQMEREYRSAINDFDRTVRRL